MRNYCLYHANCMDGYVAAWAIHSWFSRDANRTIEYIPVQYNQPLPPIEDGADVFIVDFSYPQEVIKELAIRVNWLVILDHHATAAQNLDGVREELVQQGLVHSSDIQIRFDMTRSGAALAWDFTRATRPPLLIEYVQDRDLWTWSLPYSREFSAALAAEPKDFARFTALAEHLDFRQDIHRLPAFMDFIAAGRSILATQRDAVETIALTARLENLIGYAVPVAVADRHISEVGHRLCELYPEAPFAATHFTCGPDSPTPGDEVWSLRGRGDFDVSEVAKRFGGGGHHNAAGFHRKGGA